MCPRQSHRHGWTYQGLYLPNSWTTGGKCQSALAQGRFEPPTCRSTVEHAIHQTTMTAQSRSINTPGLQRGGGGLLPIILRGSSAKTAPPREGHPWWGDVTVHRPYRLKCIDFRYTERKRKKGRPKGRQRAGGNGIKG